MLIPYPFRSKGSIALLLLTGLWAQDASSSTNATQQIDMSTAPQLSAPATIPAVDPTTLPTAKPFESKESKECFEKRDTMKKEMNRILNKRVKDGLVIKDIQDEEDVKAYVRRKCILNIRAPVNGRLGRACETAYYQVTDLFRRADLAVAGACQKIANAAEKHSQCKAGEKPCFAAAVIDIREAQAKLTDASRLLDFGVKKLKDALKMNREVATAYSGSLRIIAQKLRRYAAEGVKIDLANPQIEADLSARSLNTEGISVKQLMEVYGITKLEPEPFERRSQMIMNEINTQSNNGRNTDTTSGEYAAQQIRAADAALETANFSQVESKHLLITSASLGRQAEVYQRLADGAPPPTQTANVDPKTTANRPVGVGSPATAPAAPTANTGSRLASLPPAETNTFGASRALAGLAPAMIAPKAAGPAATSAALTLSSAAAPASMMPGTSRGPASATLPRFFADAPKAETGAGQNTELAKGPTGTPGIVREIYQLQNRIERSQAGAGVGPLRREIDSSSTIAHQTTPGLAPLADSNQAQNETSGNAHPAQAPSPSSEGLDTFSAPDGFASPAKGSSLRDMIRRRLAQEKKQKSSDSAGLPVSAADAVTGVMKDVMSDPAILEAFHMSGAETELEIREMIGSLGNDAAQGGILDTHSINLFARVHGTLVRVIQAQH